jgi:hypothetical protein
LESFLKASRVMLVLSSVILSSAHWPGHGLRCLPCSLEQVVPLRGEELVVLHHHGGARVPEELSDLGDPDALLQRVRRVGVPYVKETTPLRWVSFRRSWRKLQRFVFRAQGFPRLLRLGGTP